MREDRREGVCLDTGAEDRAAVESGGRGGVARLEELFFAVGGAGALVGLAEDGREDSEVGDVGENRAEGDGRGLDGGEVGEVVAV